MAQFKWLIRLTAAFGAIIVTGQAFLGTRRYPLHAESGIYSLTGQTAQFSRARHLSATAGVYTLVEQPASLRATLFLHADVARYMLTGQPTVEGLHLIAAPGAFVLVGKSARLHQGSTATARFLWVAPRVHESFFVTADVATQWRSPVADVDIQVAAAARSRISVGRRQFKQVG